MPRDLIIRILGQTSQFERSLKASTSSSTAFERTLKRTAVTAEQSANAQVAASLKKDARLREEIELYRRIAAAAERGSREQIVAANLADRAQRQLARSMGTTSAEARALSASTARFDRDFSHATRGVLAGSGILHSLGRSLAFASGGFLAFGGVAAFVRKSTDAAKEAQVTEAQLERQFAANGRSLDEYRARIDRTTSSLSALTGFQDDELKAGLTTILRTQPNVSKALRDTATAADLARARHIELAQAAIIVAKVEGGNTTLLRRQGIQVAKNATAEQALAVLRARVAGQAAAGATQQEKFGAVLHRTEEIIGQGILPTLNQYLRRGADWLQQMNDSGKLQHDVADAAHAFESAVSDASEVIHTADRITGSFKNTLELLLALKVGSSISGWATQIGLVGSKAAVAEGEVAGLSGSLGILARINPVVIPITLAIAADRTGLGKGVENLPGDLLKAIKDPSKQNLVNALIGAPGHRSGVVGRLFPGTAAPGDLSTARLEARLAELRAHPKQNAGDIKALDALLRKIAILDNGGTLPFAGDGKAGPAKPAAGSSGRSVTLTADQRNQFFDNAISRILRRGGLGNLQQQIAALQRADTLIKQRLAVTKDVTRRLSLEDELLQNASQIRQLQAERAASAAKAAQEAHQKAVDRLARIAAQRQGRQFRELGFTASGDNVIPGVARLSRELGSVDSAVKGTVLDKPALEHKLASIRKVLSEGLVPRDVRSRIQEMLSGVKQELDNFNKSLNRTTFRHPSSAALAKQIEQALGVDLSVDQLRRLRSQLSQVGIGGSVPGARSAPFALAGASRPIVIENVTNLDGKKIAANTTKHQQRHSQRRSVSRSGPYAGRH